MATSRVRHRGQPPRDVDHGPANGAGGVTTLGAHAQVARIAQAEASRLVEVGGRMPDGGAGKIERSMATEAQRAAWRAAEEAAAVVRAPVKAKLEVDGAHAKGSPEERAAASKARQADYRAREGIDRPAMGSPEHLHASRMRGAARHLEVVAARAEPRRPIAVLPSPVTLEEEPVMVIAAVPPPDIIDVELIVPCSNCAHEAVCSIRPTLARGLVQLMAGPLHEALRVAAPNVVIECDHFLDRTGVVLNREAARQTFRKVDEEDARAILDRVSEAISEPVDDAPVVVTRRAEAPVEPAGEPGKTAAETRRAAVAAGGGPGGRPPFVARMLEALVDADGNFTQAAAAAGIKRTSLVGSMAMLRKRTDLTDAERAAVARKRG